MISPSCAPARCATSFGQSYEPALDASGSGGLSFTRGGWLNPALLARAELQRVRYRLIDGRLVREYWPVLDRIGATDPSGEVLLTGISEFRVEFLPERSSGPDGWTAFWPTARRRVRGVPPRRSENHFDGFRRRPNRAIDRGRQLKRFGPQRGLALVSALLIVSLAGILAAGRMFQLQLESQASKALIGAARGRMIALGVEDLASQVLLADSLNSDTDHTGEAWARALGEMNLGPMLIQGTMEDMQGRFNLNNLVTLQGTPDMIAVGQFRRLLRVLQLDETLAAKTLDWMDADNLPQPLAGAEDEAYTRLSPPYQAPNRPLEDVSELLAVEGFDPVSFSILASHVTALPVYGAPTPVNVNTATEAVLLSLADRADPGQVQLWGQRQLSGGISDLQEVQRALPSNMAGRVSLGSNWFRLRVIVSVEETRFFLTSLLNRASGKTRTRWRRQGLPAEAWYAPVEG